MLPEYGFGSFVRRQTPNSKFSHTTLSDNEVIDLVEKNFTRAKPSYRKYNPLTGLDDKGLLFGGVIAIPVPAEGFFTSVCTLKEGDKLAGVYEARKKGEDPRVSYGVVGGQKIPARSVDIILYHADVLAEEKDPNWKPGALWEIISINASPELPGVEVPIHPMTLLHNHFLSTGGTATNLNPEELEAKLRVSLAYWKDKAMAAGDDT